MRSVRNYLIIITACLVALSLACNPDDPTQRQISGDLPVAATGTVTDITFDMAFCSGEVIDDGGTPLVATGLVWSTSPGPTVDDFKSESRLPEERFNHLMTELESGTTYYVRAYVQNAIGTAYGEERSFSTTIAPQCRLERFEYHSPEDGQLNNFAQYDLENRLINWGLWTATNDFVDARDYQYTPSRVNILFAQTDLRGEIFFDQDRLGQVTMFTDDDKKLVHFSYPEEGRMIGQFIDVDEDNANESTVLDSLVFQINAQGNITSIEKYTAQAGDTFVKEADYAFEYDQLANPLMGQFYALHDVEDFETYMQFFNRNNITRILKDGVEQAAYTTSAVEGTDRLESKDLVGSSIDYRFFYEHCDD